MYCPECGTENSKSQKFCTRCGTSLLAIQYARSIVSEVAGGKSSNQLEASSVLKMVSLISILGFLFFTLGTIFLSLIYDNPNGPPIGLFFGFGGLLALVMIVRRLLKLIDNPDKPKPPVIQIPNNTAQLPNRTLSEGSPGYYNSITEENTKQFENQR